MKIKKRAKTSRTRGGKTCGYGFRQKHKGHGNKGGRGVAGSGKRADQKKQKMLTLAKSKGFESYFGSKGMTSLRIAKRKEKRLNLTNIKNDFSGKDKIDLREYKILGKGDGFKATINAKAASKSAIEKMEKAGGKIVLVGEEKVEKKNSGKDGRSVKKAKSDDKK